MFQYLDDKICFLHGKPVYKKLGTRNSDKEETFETTKNSIFFTTTGISIILFANFEIS